MAIWVFKPAERDGGEMVSGVTTFESDESGTTLGTYWSSSSALDTSTPRAGHTTDQISDSNWYDNGYTGSSVGFTIMLFKVTAIGSNSSPTISDLNNDQLITDVLHSTASGSANGVNHYNGSTTAYTMDWGNQTITSNGTTYTLDGLTQVSGNATPNVRQRTQNNDQGNVYYNGILVSSQTGGGSDDGLAWYQNQGDPNYFDNITESNFFNNHTDVTNKRKNHKRAMTSLAESTSTDTIEKFTKLMNLKLLDRIIDADDFREAERFALSRLTDSEQTEIKNIIRYS